MDNVERFLEELDKLQSKRVIKTKTEGFDSLVSGEELDILVRMSNLMAEFEKVHMPLIPKTIDNISDKDRDYQMFQYIAYLKLCGELESTLHLLTDIHSLDKKTIDEYLESQGLTLHELVAKEVAHVLADILLK